MTSRTASMRRIGPGIALVVLACAVTGCDGRDAPHRALAPSPPEQPALPSAPVLERFTEAATGFSTSDVRDAQEQIVQFSTGTELIWAADGTRLRGYKVHRATGSRGIEVSFIEGAICPEWCMFEVRFGTVDGERRAYLTLDYGHDNPGTLADVDVVKGSLVVEETTQFPPGTFVMSGRITELAKSGTVPVAGVSISRLMTTGWQGTSTDSEGLYRLGGMFDGTDEVHVRKDGYESIAADVTIAGDTRYDARLVRR